MEPESDRYNIWKNRDLFGIYDLQINTWVLDCFDYPQLFLQESMLKNIVQNVSIIIVIDMKLDNGIK